MVDHPEFVTQPEEAPGYWESIWGMAALGWMDEVEQLLRLHSALLPPADLLQTQARRSPTQR
eukprot:7917035-Pyramimonas_sp.AAC.1